MWYLMTISTAKSVLLKNKIEYFTDIIQAGIPTQK